jgi:ATP adenylyltransferase
MKICSFCSELSQDTIGNYFLEVTNDDLFDDRVIWSNDDFAIIPTIGCMVEGYVLLITKNHISSFSGIANEKLSDLRKLVKKVSEVMKGVYGSGCVMFEHGSVKPKQCGIGGGACEDHAHIHFVPVSVELSKFAKKRFVINEINDLSHLQSFEERNMPYLFFSDPDSKQYVCDAPTVVSQFFRQIISVNLGLGNTWRWQTFPFTENMKRTYKTLKPAFKNFIL